MKPMPWAGLLTGLLLLAFLSGCSSSPVRFHTLMQPPEASERVQNPVAIDVESVRVPAPVDRNELVVRQGDTDLLVLSSDWWGASLAQEIRSALVARFAVAGQETSPLVARIEITRFDVVAGKGAWLDARYDLSATGASPTNSLTCSARLYSAADSSVEALVQAQQHNLETLAEQMLTAGNSLADSKRCP